MIAVDCPDCGKHFEVSPELAGKKSRCKKCGAIFRIPILSARLLDAGAERCSPEPEPQLSRASDQPEEQHWEWEPVEQKPLIEVAPAPGLSSYEESDLPPPPRAASPRPARRPKKAYHRAESDIGVTASQWFLALAVLLFLVGFGLTYFQMLPQGPSRTLGATVLILTSLGSFAMVLWGALWILAAAFQESMWCGIMCLFVPFYQLYYIWTRYDETRGGFYLQVSAGFVLGLVSALGPALNQPGLAAGNNGRGVLAEVPGAPALVPAPAVGMPLPFDPGRVPVPGGGPGRLAGFGPVARFQARVDSQYEAMRARHGDRVIMIVVSGLPGNTDHSKGVTTRDASDAITKRMRTLAPSATDFMSIAGDNKLSLFMAPINDASALANSIDFGTATLNGTRIDVELKPDFIASVPRLPPEPAVTRAPSPKPEFPPDADAVTKSLAQLKSPDLGHRKEALNRLARTAPDQRIAEVVALVVPMLNDDDGFLVNDAIQALVTWKSPDAVMPLVDRVRDNRFFVRKQAIKALGKFKDPRSVEPILAQINEDGFEVEEALKEIGPSAEPALIGRLRDPDRNVRSRACDILKAIGGQETLKAMQAIPRDSDLGVQMAAENAWKQIVARVGPPPSLKKSGARRRAAP
jgi:hypothetical protein